MKARSIFVLILACVVGLTLVESANAGRIAMTAVTYRREEPHPPLGRRGDLENIRWSLRDRHGRTIGTGLFNCRWHRSQERLCIGEIQLPLGKLTCAGTSLTRALGEWAVTGGTGRYTAAGGTLLFRATGVRKLTVIITI